MSPEEFLTQAGIQVSFSTIDVPSFRASSMVNTRAARFIRFQQEVLRHEWERCIAFAIHLIAFDGVAPQDFEWMRTHTTTLRSTPIGTALELSNDDEVVRRHLLSSLTLKWTDSAVAWDDTHQAVLIKALTSTDVYAQLNEAAALVELRCDQLAWAFQRLPSSVFSHMAGLIPCTPLPTSTWERLLTGEAPLATEQTPATEAEANSGDLLDATENTTSGNQSPALIQLALECLYEEPTEKVQSCLSRWSRSLAALAPKLHSYSPHVGLIISWIAHVVENGTSQKRTQANPTTRRRYAQVAAIPLFRAIQSLPANPGLWDKDMRVAAFVSIMSATNRSDKRALSAAIASFQFFLLEAFDLRPIDAGLKDFVTASKPRAQCIFVHEVERASSWFAAARMDDERLRPRLQAALWLSYDAPFRINELLFLRKGNIVKLDDGSYEITIVSRRGAQLKTPAATRRVSVRLPQACIFLSQLIAQRDREGWASKDLLFGAGTEGSTPYRKNRLRNLLLIALKVATGDPEMTIHALRHSWVCRELAALLLSSSVCNFNRLSHLAAQVGHESVHTTLEYYFHWIEQPLRVHLDAALRFELKWTSDTGARYTSMTASALRQRASRAKLSVEALTWSMLQAPTLEQSEVALPHLVGWGIPVAPDLTDKSMTPLTPALLMQFLLAVERAEHSAEVLAQRYGVNIEQGRIALQHLTEVRTQLQRANYIRRSAGHRVIDRASSDLRLRKIQQPKYASLVASLAEIPEERDLLQRGVKAWKALRNRYGYISVVDQEATYSFLSLLRYLGLQAHNLDVVISRSVEPELAAALQASLEGTFLSAMVAHPSYIHGAPPHPMRPSAFLQWHPPADEKKTSANSDLKGLDAVFLVLSVYLHVSKG